jgi:hypothetical protein
MSLVSLYRTVSLGPFVAGERRGGSFTMLTARPGLPYAIACSSFPGRPIALLNAFIILSYIISLLWNVPVKIAPSLIGMSGLEPTSQLFSVSNLRKFRNDVLKTVLTHIVQLISPNFSICTTVPPL